VTKVPLRRIVRRFDSELIQRCAGKTPGIAARQVLRNGSSGFALRRRDGICEHPSTGEERMRRSTVYWMLASQPEFDARKVRVPNRVRAVLALASPQHYRITLPVYENMIIQ
jgi:hypothetical protein